MSKAVLLIHGVGCDGSVWNRMAPLLTEKALIGKDDPTPLLNIEIIFGNLSESSVLVTTVTDHLQQLYALGTQETLSRLLSDMEKK